jgi:amino acid transporter
MARGTHFFFDLLLRSNISATFWNGGPRSLVWGAIAVIIGSLAQAYSMAELGSILPIAGAQYHWTHIMAPESSRRFITWMQGAMLRPPFFSRWQLSSVVQR